MRPLRSSPLASVIILTAVPVAVGFASDRLATILLLATVPLWVVLVSDVIEPLARSPEGRVAQIVIAAGGITFMALAVFLFGSDHIWLGIGCAGAALVPLASVVVVHLDR
jgi:hypothetical protein